MTTVTKQQVLARWETLSDALREALASQESAEVLQRILEAEHVPDYKRGLISGAVGLVLLGFIHPEELQKEIEGATSLPPQVATSVTSAVVSRILEPLRQELNRAYAPVGSAPRPVTSGIPTLIPSSAVKPAGTPMVSSQQWAVGSGARPTPPQAGGQTPLSSQAPTPSGFVSNKPAPQAVPAPVMLHREAEFRPIQQGSSSLRGDILGKPPAGTGATSMFSGKPSGTVPQAPIAAKIEFGSSGIMKTQGPTISRTEADIPRVVHYSEMKTPVSPFGAAEAGAVRMPQAPHMPTPPMPPIPPMPSSARTSQGGILASKPATPPAPATPPMPPYRAANTEVNYTQPAITSPAAARSIPPLVSSQGMTDLKKIMTATPPSSSQVPQSGNLNGKPPPPPAPPRPAAEAPTPNPAIPKPPIP